MAIDMRTIGKYEF